MKTTIFVTGGDGIIGKSLQKIVYLKQYNNIQFKEDYKWIFLHKYILNLTDYDEVYNFFNDQISIQNKPVVINLAKYTPLNPDNLDNIIEIYEKNLRIDSNIITVCIKLKIKKFINLFPVEILEIFENKKTTYNESSSENYNYLYSKINSIYYSRAINNCSDKYCYTNLFLPKIFSEYDFQKLGKTTIITELIETIDSIKKINYNRQLIPKIIYVDDISNIIIDFISIFNVQGDYLILPPNKNSLTIEELVKFISKELNYNLPFEYDKENNNITDYMQNLNTNKIDTLYKKYNLNIDNRFNFKLGIRSVIKWYITNNVQTQL